MWGEVLRVRGYHAIKKALTDFIDIGKNEIFQITFVTMKLIPPLSHVLNIYHMYLNINILNYASAIIIKCNSPCLK